MVPISPLTPARTSAELPRPASMESSRAEEREALYTAKSCVLAELWRAVSPRMALVLGSDHAPLPHAPLGDSTQVVRVTRDPEELLTAIATQPDASLIAIPALEWVDSPALLLARIRKAAPDARMLVGMTNSASASAILRSLCETDDERGVAALVAERWFRDAGYRVARQEPVSGAPAARLAADVRQSVSALLSQLSPSSASDWVGYLLEPEASTVSVASPDLLSVVVRTHSVRRIGLLDHAIFSLACQQHSPLEIVLATQAMEPDALAAYRQLLDRHQLTGRFTYQIVHVPSEADIRGRLINVGVHAARGRYVAFLDDDDVVYPDHYVRLVKALRDGDAAWAVGLVRRAYFARTPDGHLYCKLKDLMPQGPSYDLPQLLRENYVTCSAYVLDRDRLGAFPVAFSEKVSRHEDYLFLVRLAALFRPAWVTGHPTCEYRIRDDGSNSINLPSHPLHVRVHNEKQWKRAEAELARVRAKTIVLLTAAELEHHLRRFYDAGAKASGLPAYAGSGAAPVREQLRYRIVDRLNSVVKSTPGVHRWLKALLARRF